MKWCSTRLNAVFLFHKNDGVIAHTVSDTVDIASRQSVMYTPFFTEILAMC